MDFVLAMCVAVGLAAACGFRVFVPMLVTGCAVRLGWFSPSEGFMWIESWPALAAFAAASLVEIGAFYIPWIDNALDAIAAPAAVVAGAVASAAALSIGDMPPLLTWSAAIIAGGGIAGVIKGTAAATRAGSTATTGGSANFIVATGEWIGSLILSILAIVVPILAAALVLAILLVVSRVILTILRRRAARRASQSAATAA